MALNQDLHGGWWDAGDFNKYTNWGASDVIELMHAYTENASATAFTDATSIPEGRATASPIFSTRVKWEARPGRGRVPAEQRLGPERRRRAGGRRAPAFERAGQHGAVDGDRALRLRPGLGLGLAHRGRSLRLRRGYLRGPRLAPAAPPTPATPPPSSPRRSGPGPGAQANPAVFFCVLDGEPHRRRPASRRSHDRSRPQLRAAGQAAARPRFTCSRRPAPPATATSSTPTTPGINVIAEGYADGSHGTGAGDAARVHPGTERLPPRSSRRSRPPTSARCRPATVAAGRRHRQPRSLPGFTCRATEWGINQIKETTRGTCSTTSSRSESTRRPAPRPPKGPSVTFTTFTGVNPLQLCYLSNMGSYGAQKSVTRFFHSWYAKGSNWDAAPGVSKYGPPPGYLTGERQPQLHLGQLLPERLQRLFVRRRSALAAHRATRIRSRTSTSTTAGRSTPGRSPSRTTATRRGAHPPPLEVRELTASEPASIDCRARAERPRRRTTGATRSPAQDLDCGYERERGIHRR